MGFEFPNYQARENEPSVFIGVLQGNDGEQTVTVDYILCRVGLVSGAEPAWVAAVTLDP